MGFDVDEYQRLDDVIREAREAINAHVRKVIVVQRGDRPLNPPEQAIDNSWLEEYERLRQAEREAQEARDQYVQQNYWRRS